MDRNFEAMLVWMDEEPMDLNKSFFIKQTTNLSRSRISSIKYKVDVNTMEQLSVENGQLTTDSLPTAVESDSTCCADYGKRIIL